MSSSALLLFLLALRFPDPTPAFDPKTIESLSDSFWKARPKTYFESWDPALHADLLSRAAQIGAIPEGSLDAIRALLWKGVKHAALHPKNHEIDTPYGKAKWLTRGKGGRSPGLVLGLHGGGENAGSAEEAMRYEVKDCIGVYPQGIRLVHDTWNTVHGERFCLTLIELAKQDDDVDPDRVYSLGFSMGGTGSWFLAGRHPDLLAGAMPAAGVLMADPQSQVMTKQEVKVLQHGFVPNVRNLAMYWYIGTADDHCMPGTYLFAWDRLAELKQQDPDGYKLLEFKTYDGLKHAFPKGEPESAEKWLAPRVRDAFPKKIVWEYATDPFPLPIATDKVTRLQKHWYYWLRCDDPKDNMLVAANHEGNEFDFSVKRADPASFTILLNPTMIDVAKDVVVRVDGKEVWRGKPAPDFATILESLDARMDKTLVFDRSIRLDSLPAFRKK